ncbi:hypothetical protein EVAR_51369_1 [Eumeta japonica]|uniref:Uncharacterized protein n=1 Tax=Eumeta variegata TaxID=151549 RepID=A0A4C1Y2Z0_EUMVA|nr:hypothetical protein EVAR_51369_1 [Eumeta japonica]
MLRRLPSGVIHSACHAPLASTCRPAAFGEAIVVVQLHNIAYSNYVIFKGDLFSGFQSHTTYAYGREGVRYHLPCDPRLLYFYAKKLKISTDSEFPDGADNNSGVPTFLVTMQSPSDA